MAGDKNQYYGQELEDPMGLGVSIASPTQEPARQSTPVADGGVLELELPGASGDDLPGVPLEDWHAANGVSSEGAAAPEGWAPSQRQGYEFRSDADVAAGSDMGFLPTFATAATDSVLSNFGDEAMAGIQSAVGPQKYDEELDAIRKAREMAYSQQQMAALSGGLTGSVLQGILLAGAAAPVAKGAGLAAPAVGSAEGAGAFLARQAALGATQGAAAGLGSGDSASDRLSGAAMGGALGGALGYAGGKATVGLGKLANSARRVNTNELGITPSAAVPEAAPPAIPEELLRETEVSPLASEVGKIMQTADMSASGEDDAVKALWTASEISKGRNPLAPSVPVPFEQAVKGTFNQSLDNGFKTAQPAWKAYNFARSAGNAGAQAGVGATAGGVTGTAVDYATGDKEHTWAKGLGALGLVAGGVRGATKALPPATPGQILNKIDRFLYKAPERAERALMYAPPGAIASRMTGDEYTKALEWAKNIISTETQQYGPVRGQAASIQEQRTNPALRDVVGTEDQEEE